MNTPGAVFDALVARQPAPEPAGGSEAEISVPALVEQWLADGPRVFSGVDRMQLEALCRQIDVRRTVAVGYRSGWKRVDPEIPASATTVAGLVAVLLANAGPLTSHARDGGWGLKCANSAFKALELREEIPEAARLRAWALTVLDHRTGTPR